MHAAPMISYAQNREDVVLWRALHQVGTGRYAELGADGDGDRSMTKVFADHGWRGLVVVADAGLAAARRDARQNEVVEVAGDNGAAVDWSRNATGDLHLLVVVAHDPARWPGPADLPLRDLQPWVVVVTDTGDEQGLTAQAWEAELAAAGYEPCLFDGVSRFYVAADRSELRPALSYPACVRDQFTDRREAELADEVSRLEAAVQQARDESLGELLRWRHAAVTTWAKTAATRTSGVTPTEYHELQVALAAAQRDAAEVRQTLSWRVTKPLRMVKSAGRRQ